MDLPPFGLLRERKINLKNTKQYEGIVLNLYKPKKKEQLINDLKLKIDKC